MANITIILDHTRAWGSIFRYLVHQETKKVLSEGEKFWEESSTITTGSLPKKIMPMDSVFTYYRL
jgi:hypothetical protein